VTLKDLLSDLQDHREALLDGRGDAGGHLGGGVPVVGAHGAAPQLAAATGGFVAISSSMTRAGMPASSSQVA